MKPSMGGEQEAAGVPRSRLDALARLSGLRLFWEALWPPLAFAMAVAALFAAVSWTGLWLFAPVAARIAGVVAFGLALVLALSPLARLRWPTRASEMASLDRDAQVLHRPASSFDDRIAQSEGTPETQALWALHHERLERQLAALKVRAPSPGVARRDGRALRFGALVAFVAAAFVAGPERYGRVAAAFDWRGGGDPAAGVRIDAWIDPPAYAGKAPIILDVLAPDAARKISAPAGSTLVVKSEAGSVQARVEGALAPIEAKPPTPGAASAPLEWRWTVKGDGKLEIAQGGAPLATFAIDAIADAKPTIELSEAPRANFRGSLTIKYRVADQYGLTSAEANFEAGAGAKPRALAEAPKIALQLPATADGSGDAQTTADLADHPWAGARVMLTLKAIDLAGETGVSAPLEITLPQRRFFNPLARALVEQRRALVLDPDASPPRVAAAIDALLLAPDDFQTPAKAFLGLRHAGALLAAARGDPQLLEVADLLWAMALDLEEGDASTAERDLRATEKSLREALARGAGDDELRKLMQDLRAAAERFAQSLAKDDPGNEDQAGAQQDLGALLDQMEKAAREGTREDAQAMLDQLQDLLENMKGARGEAQSPAAKEMQKQLGELDKLTRDQQALRDDTFRSDEQDRKRRLSPNPDQPGQPETGQDGQGQDGQASDGQGLPQRQEGLGERLERMRRALKDLGVPAQKGLDDAEDAMREAEGDLKGQGAGKPGQTGKSGAVGAQGRALQALREGMQGLQQQMQGEKGQPGGVKVGRKGRDEKGRDPLGRGPAGNKGQSEGQLHEGVSGAERARRVMEELRRRLGEPQRGQDERDYLDRLIRRQ